MQLRDLQLIASTPKTAGLPVHSDDDVKQLPAVYFFFLPTAAAAAAAAANKL
jgi:hypothetical protein